MLRYSTDIRRSNFFVKFQFGNGVTLREIYLNLWLVKRKLEGSAKIKSKIEKHPSLTFSLIRSLDWSFRLIDVLKIKEKEKKNTRCLRLNAMKFAFPPLFPPTLVCRRENPLSSRVCSSGEYCAASHKDVTDVACKTDATLWRYWIIVHVYIHKSREEK